MGGELPHIVPLLVRFVVAKEVIFAESDCILVDHDNGFKFFQLNKDSFYQHKHQGLVAKVSVGQILHNFDAHFKSFAEPLKIDLPCAD